MLFDISPLQMQLESFENEQNIPANQKNGLEYIVGMWLECSSKF